MDELTVNLAEALRDVSERFRRCLVYSGTDEEFADIAIKQYRDLVATYDSACEAEEAKRAAEAMI